MTGPLLKLEHLEVRYGDLIGVSDVSLDVPEGSVVALLGSNGGGKTTTLNAIAGLIPLHAGSISFRGEEIAGQNAFAIVRKGLALSPEGWRLFVQQSVENNLLLGATPLRDKARTAQLLERVYEIFPKLKERRGQRAGTMSGGERQMLAVARALMSDPKLLMLDEPSLGLAPAVVESMYETFGRLHREGLTILLAEQSIELALEVSDFATVLQVGKSVLSGTAAELAQDPQVQRAYLGAGRPRRAGAGVISACNACSRQRPSRASISGSRSEIGPGSLRIALTSVPNTSWKPKAMLRCLAASRPLPIAASSSGVARSVTARPRCLNGIHLSGRVPPCWSVARSTPSWFRIHAVMPLTRIPQSPARSTPLKSSFSASSDSARSPSRAVSSIRALK